MIYLADRRRYGKGKVMVILIVAVLVLGAMLFVETKIDYNALSIDAQAWMDKHNK
jgi:hypothetical protein